MTSYKAVLPNQWVAKLFQVGREAISGGSRSISKCYSFLLDREIIALSLHNKMQQCNKYVTIRCVVSH